MLFSSALFLFVFLPGVLIIYYLLPAKAKNPFLLVASIVFYISSDPKSVFLLIFTAFLNYAFALIIARRSRFSKVALILCLAADFSVLFFFKYSHFFLSLFFGDSVPEPALPVGISFYTFQAASYTIDVYRNDCRCERSFPTFATYLCLFPQLIAGPIVRYSDVEDSMLSRQRGPVRFSDGVFLFARGLAKKVVIADSLFVLGVGYAESMQRDVLFSWLYAVSFTLRIYFDFSGYTDMARALGKMFGFEFPENFRHPYAAKTVSEFWRRWHMTLSSWFRSYVYIPLGGNRCSKARNAFNIAVVWVLTGLWHGANFTFIAWGALYALLLIAEKMLFPALRIALTQLFDRRSRRSFKKDGGRPYVNALAAGEVPVAYSPGAGQNGMPDSAEGLSSSAPVSSSAPSARPVIASAMLSFAGHVYTMFFVICGFVIFNADSLGSAFSTLSDMLLISGAPLFSTVSLYYLKSYSVLVAASSVLSLPVGNRLKRIFHTLVGRLNGRLPFSIYGRSRFVRRLASLARNAVRPAAVLACLMTSLFFIIGGSYKPFLYFRF